MLARDFVYWLQGLFELADPSSLDEKQTELIRKHLAMVFIHEIDPSDGDEEMQEKLNEAHGDVTREEVEELKSELRRVANRPRGPLVMRC